MRFVQWGVFAIVAVALVASTASAQVRYVHPGGNNANDGDGWGSSDAWQTLGHALAKLSEFDPGFDTIYIASGTYLPPVPSSGDPRLATFAVTKRVEIYGGFNAASPESAPALRALGAYPTILLGDLDEDDDPADDGTLVDNAYHVMTITASFAPTSNPLILDGLDFEAGVADGFATNANKGGAVLWYDVQWQGEGKLLVRHCRFERNRAAESGGALYSAFNTTLRDCTFRDNRVIGVDGFAEGGAVPIHGVTNENTTPRLTAANCVFVDNLALGIATGGFPTIPGNALGGAVCALGGGVIANCEFRGNQALVEGTVGLFGGRGGALWFESLSGEDDRRVTNCLFAGNTATSRGGAIEAYIGIVIRSCTIVDNESIVETGGGVQLFGQIVGPIPDTSLWNCIVWGNSAGAGGTSEEQQVASSSTGAIQYNYSIIDGAGGLAPDFIDRSGGDYRLAEGSRGIDEGDNDLLDLDAADVDDDSDLAELHPLDLDRLGRIHGASCIVDVGAYEFVPSCIADLNGDGSVDGADLGILLSAWGTCTDPCCPSDLTGDGQVDGADLGILLASWGDCPGFVSFSESPTLLEVLEELGFEGVEAFEAWLLFASDEEVHAVVEN